MLEIRHNYNFSLGYKVGEMDGVLLIIIIIMIIIITITIIIIIFFNVSNKFYLSKI